MKKIITFLFCSAVISSAFAQAGNGNWNERNTYPDHYINSIDSRYNDKQNDYRNDHGYNDVYHQNIIAQRDQEIQKVNYQDNCQVQLVINDCNLKIWEKRDVLNNLEAQRIQKINDIYSRYSNTIAYYNGNDVNNSCHHHHQGQ